MTQIGSSSQTYHFNSAGATIIKLESADNKRSFVQFGTTVYKNPMPQKRYKTYQMVLLAYCLH